MKCPQCGQGNPDGARFCNGCGVKLETRCAACGQANPPASRFCNGCGHGLSEPVAPRPEPPPLKAERRQLTVLFSDLVGSTELSSRLDPEVLRDIVRSYHEVCAPVIDRFQGHVAQHLGDGLLVYFGYPVAHEDDAQRAVRAALGIVAAMETLNARLGREQGIRLALRLGIHTGLVVVGEIGGGSRQEQLALGETPNIAARLQAIAEPDTVVISAATYRLAQGAFFGIDLGEHVVKGLPTPVRVYRVQDDGAAVSSLEPSTGGSLTPLVGRDQEVGLLLSRWEQVKEGLGQAVLLSGEPGIGKSRLVRTLKEHIAGEPHTRWECRCSAYHQDSALYPVLDLLERALQFGRDDLPTQKLAKIEAALARYGLAQPEAVALWAALLSVPVPEDRPPLNLTPQRQKQKTFEAVLGLLFALAAQQPVVFIIEDLHWVDPSTRELLDLVLEQVPTRSILMVLTCRPEFRPPWGNRAHLTHLTLNRFTRRQTGLMVERVTGGKVLPQERTAEVEPELLAHHYTEGGLVDEAIGFWPLAGKRAFKQGANTETIAHLTKGLEVLRSLPDGRERLDRECDLQAALGMTSMSTKGYAAPEVEQTYLRALDLSRQTGNTVQRFRAGWGLFWVSMLRAEVPKCWEVGEELVRLAAPVGDPALLVPAHDARGQNAYYFGDLPAARRHLERAILIWDSGRHDVEGVHAPVQHAPWSSSLTSGNTIGSRSHLALALWCLGYPAQALERSRDTLALARTAAQPQSRAYALGFASMFHHLRHEGAVAHAQAETMIELAREQRLPLWLAMARCRLGAALIDLGRPEEGIESMREGLEAWRATGAELETPYRLSVLAEAYGRLGQIEAGLGAVAQALAAVNKSGEGVWKAELKRLRGDLLLTQSDENGPEAEACFRQAIAVASRQQAKSLELRATLSFSRLLQRQGKREDARRILADIYEWFTEGFDTPDLKDARALLDELTTR